jgi:hypothetical protein
VRGVSERLDRALLGVRAAIPVRWPTMVRGAIFSPGDMALAQGLFEGSSTVRVRLSLLLSRMLFGSPRTARARDSPEDAPPPDVLPEVDDSAAATLELAVLEVSMWRVLVEEFPPLDDVSSSTQPAGVGGTGPREETASELECPGRRVGGDVMRSVDEERLALWDLDCGGGHGGGGGSGIPGSHLDLEVDEARDRALDGVSIAPVEAALREAGGRESTSPTCPSS